MILKLVCNILIALFGAWIFSIFGKKLGFIDHPNDRSSHSLPTPKGGGLGILLSFLSNAMFYNLPWKFWLPAFILASVSLLGDHKELLFKIRLLVQFISSLVICASIFIIEHISLNNGIISGLIFVFYVFFIIATTNYYNFMDGINGLAGFTGFIAFVGLGLFGIYSGKEINFVYSAFGIAGACLGFLPFNFPKARVFMGDVGSILLGFLFASFVVLFSKSILEFIFLILLLFPFYIDELCTLIVRIKDKNNLTKPHRRHIYQILANQAGFSHPCVTSIYSLLQIFVIIFAWIVMKAGLVLLVMYIFILSTLFFMVSLYIRNKWET